MLWGQGKRHYRADHENLMNCPDHRRYVPKPSDALLLAFRSYIGYFAIIRDEFFIMKKLRVVVSLITTGNDYQREQANAVEQSARRLGIDTQIFYADNDAITQSQQLLNIIQGAPDGRPDGIICHPVGTALAQVARAAVQNGIGWVVVNRETDYFPELRALGKVPAFCVTVDQEEVGRIQSRQFAALLPDGGLILYIQGPSGNFSAERRLAGMQSIKPKNLEVRTLRGGFTEQSGYEAIRSWLRLSTSRDMNVRLVACQNDAMTVGARKALMEDSSRHWAHLLFTGCDVCGEAGQNLIRKGALNASIVLPSTAGLALEMLAHSCESGSQPTASTVLMPVSFPALEKLGPVGTR
jgi:ribose transport system substrate-binding protein